MISLTKATDITTADYDVFVDVRNVGKIAELYGFISAVRVGELTHMSGETYTSEVRLTGPQSAHDQYVYDLTH